MAVNVEERAGSYRFDVIDVFHPEDATLIETLAESLPRDAEAFVDFRNAREKHLLALWLLAMAAQRAPGRYRIAGLTGADRRFLTMMGAGMPRGDLPH